MSIRDWPVLPEFKPVNVQFGADTPQTAWAATYTGQRQSISNNADRAVMTFGLAPSIDQAGQGAQQAYLLGLKSRGDTVRLPYFPRMYPLGTMRGSPVLAANALTGANSVQIAGALAGSNLISGGGFEIDSNADGLADGWTLYVNGTTGTLTKVVANGPLFPGAGGKFQLFETTALNGNVGVLRSIPAAAGATYTFGIHGNTTSGADIMLYVNWVDAGLASLGDLSVSTGFAPGRRYITSTAPASTAYAIVYAYARSTAGTPVTLNLDEAQWERSATGTPYSGPASLMPGDMLAVGNQFLHVDYPGVVLNDAGAGTVPLSLGVRSALTAGSAVIWSKPTGLFQIVGVVPDLDYQPGGLQLGPELSFIETGY